jgi:branched-chain amino acid transport system permease protein
MKVYVLAGLVVGSIYAIVALGLTVTYVTSRVFNFAHGAIAFFVAEFYYFLHTSHGLPAAAAAPISILVIAPAIALVLWALVFRRLANCSTVVKVVTTVGLYVALPALALTIFGTNQSERTSGFFSGNSPEVHVLGVVVTGDQLAAMAAALLVAVLFGFLLKRTSLGVRMRAVVDHRELASVYGVNPTAITATAWAIGASLAGLGGILLLPTLGLNQAAFTSLLVASFAAVVVARLHSLPVTFLAAVGIGLVQNVISSVLPSSGVLAEGVQPSIPFFVLIAFLIAYAVIDRRRGVPADIDDVALIVQRSRRTGRNRVPAMLSRGVAWVAPVVVVPFLLSDYWLGVIALGVVYGVLFLSYTTTVGEGGIISLCQVSFAGFGAVLAAQLASVYGWPVVPALIIGGLVAVPISVIVSTVGLRLGDLYLALLTLSFAVLADNLVFGISRFYNGGAGVPLPRPSFATGSLSFYVLGLVAFAIGALLLVNLRRSTTGMVMAAVRTAERAAATIGIVSGVPKVAMFAVGAGIAGIGGALVSDYTQVTNPVTFDSLIGLVWLAVVVIFGVRSIAGALLAGLAFALIPALFSAYLPDSLSNVPAILFGSGAVLVADHPGGIMEILSGQLRWLAETGQRVLGRERPAASPAGLPDVASASAAPADPDNLREAGS